MNNIWHPCTQMKDHEICPPIKIKSAQGSYLELENGNKIIDAISSWWCKSLGHNHPKLKQALINQLDKFEHVILANTSNNLIEEFSKKIANITAPLDKIQFASDGACAVEIALKMSLHAQTLNGYDNKTEFITLENSYHGETIGTLSVSDLGIYKKPYEKLLFKSNIIKNIPYVNFRTDPVWDDCSKYWDNIEYQLEFYKNKSAAIILEPIVQGAGGMKIYSKDFLKRIRKWSQKNNIFLIADEIFTGFGRTGKELAINWANITPDFICLGKNLTSGMLPLSLTVTSNEIYNLFYNDYDPLKSFLHSHTHSGNNLAIAVANATLNIYKNENIIKKSAPVEQIFINNFLNIKKVTNKINNIRSIGSIVAADLDFKNMPQRTGFKLMQEAIKFGALIRPLGNTVYWTPPLNISTFDIDKLHNITKASILNL